MIQSYINSLLLLTSNESSVVFEEENLKGRSCAAWLCHSKGSANYNITRGGAYEVNFNATISSAAAGVVAFQLFNNGEPIPGTLMAETLAAAGDYANIGINAKIPVCNCANSNISVRSVPTVPTATDATTPIATQVPIIASATFSITREG